MFVVINHNITDPKKWDEATSKIGPMVEHGQLPRGVKALFYLPSTDNRKAVCVWETDSLDNLKRFLEPQTGTAARNEYFQVNLEHAMGLPAHAPQHLAAH
jgi:hypothetical protein